MDRPSDFLIHNARIYTVNDAHPRASALAVRNGRFVRVGESQELLNAYPDIRRLDAEGATIVPGFIDAHAHLQKLGLSLQRADLTDTNSASEVVERLKAFASEENLPETAWLRGHGWDQTEWSSTRPPSRRTLDQAFPHRPVWLTRIDVHAGWANTAALEATVGLHKLQTMSDPEGGHIHRDADDHPTGVLVDTAMDLVTDQIPAPSESKLESALRSALQHTARRGLTSLHDAGTDLSTIRRYHRFIEDETFPLRVYAMIDDHGDAFTYFCEQGPLRHKSGQLRVESVKLFADGALGSRGAALLDDYADDPGNRGILLHSEEEFRGTLERAVECGFQVNTHAIGDRANRFVLNAYEAAMQTCTEAVRRPRIEHAQVVHPDDVPRFGRLGIIASVQPRFATSDMDWASARLGTDRLDRAYAWKSLRDAGASLAFGSDAPVESIDPLENFYAAITRQDAEGHPEGGWRPEERLSRSTALYAYTLGAAHAAFQEDAVGSIAPDKRADFTVLSHDLMQVPPSKLLDTEVIATYIGGCPVYTRDDGPAV